MSSISENSKRKILNVGCGEDTYGTHFVDLYPTRKEVIKCNVDKEKLPFPNNYFDQVVAKFIFEHLTSHRHFLKEVYRVLKKNGKLILMTDNASFWGLFGMTHYGKYEKEREKEKIYEDRHYALFTPNHLRNWLRLFGFRKIKIEYTFYDKYAKKTHIPLIKILSKIIPRMSPHIKVIAIK